MYHHCLPHLPEEEYQGYALMLGHDGKHSIAFRYQTEEEASAYHLHSYIEIIYVQSGYMSEMIEGEHFTLKEKQICILNRNCSHRDLRTESEGVTFFLGLRPSAFNSFVLGGLKKSAIREFMINALQHKQKVSHFQLSVNAVDAAYIEKNIEQNLAEVSVDALCREFHYQKDYYNRIIQKHTGLTFAAYLQSLRLEKAKNLLSSTDLSAGEIGWQVGYKNPSYFFQVFREKTGMTPLEYRKKNL